MKGGFPRRTRDALITPFLCSSPAGAGGRTNTEGRGGADGAGPRGSAVVNAWPLEGGPRVYRVRNLMSLPGAAETPVVTWDRTQYTSRGVRGMSSVVGFGGRSVGNSSGARPSGRLVELPARVVFRFRMGRGDIAAPGRSGFPCMTKLGSGWLGAPRGGEGRPTCQGACDPQLPGLGAEWFRRTGLHDGEQATNEIAVVRWRQQVLSIVCDVGRVLYLSLIAAMRLRHKTRPCYCTRILESLRYRQQRTLASRRARDTVRQW